MDTTRLSARGQIVLPKHIRASQNWGPGATFIVEETSEGILLRPAGQFPETDIDEVAGCLRSGRKRKAISRVNEAIDSEVMRRHDGGRY